MNEWIAAKLYYMELWSSKLADTAHQTSPGTMTPIFRHLPNYNETAVTYSTQPMEKFTIKRCKGDINGCFWPIMHVIYALIATTSL